MLETCALVHQKMTEALTYFTSSYSKLTELQEIVQKEIVEGSKLKDTDSIDSANPKMKRFTVLIAKTDKAKRLLLLRKIRFETLMDRISLRSKDFAKNMAEMCITIQNNGISPNFRQKLSAMIWTPTPTTGDSKAEEKTDEEDTADANLSKETTAAKPKKDTLELRPTEMKKSPKAPTRGDVVLMTSENKLESAAASISVGEKSYAIAAGKKTPSSKVGKSTGDKAKSSSHKSFLARSRRNDKKKSDKR